MLRVLLHTFIHHYDCHGFARKCIVLRLASNYTKLICYIRMTNDAACAILLPTWVMRRRTETPMPRWGWCEHAWSTLFHWKTINRRSLKTKYNNEHLNLMVLAHTLTHALFGFENWEEKRWKLLRVVLCSNRRNDTPNAMERTKRKVKRIIITIIILIEFYLCSRARTRARAHKAVSWYYRRDLRALYVVYSVMIVPHACNWYAHVARAVLHRGRSRKMQRALSRLIR